MAIVLRAVTSITESLEVDGGHSVIVVKYFKSQIVVFLMTIYGNIGARLGLILSVYKPFYIPSCKS